MAKITTEHTVELDPTIGAEPVFLDRDTDEGAWWIYSDNGDGSNETVAHGQEWINAKGEHCVAIASVFPGADEAKVRAFIEGLEVPAGIPTYS